MPIYDVSLVNEDGSEYTPLGQIEARSEEEAVKAAAKKWNEPENDLLAQEVK